MQLCLTLCNPMDYTVHGILQARILEWVAISFSRGSSQPRDQTQVSHIVNGFFTSWTTREAHGGSDSKESALSVGDLGLIPGLERILWRRKWQPTPVFLPGEFHGHGITKSQTWLSNFTFTFNTSYYNYTGVRVYTLTVYALCSPVSIL